MIKVLLIEDDKELAINLTELLEWSNFTVFLAENGREALSNIDVYNPDIIVSDVRMPGMDGSTFLEELKNIKKYRGIPFIFISAIVDANEVRRLFNLGADDYLSKPFSFAQLIESINSRVTRFRELKERAGKISFNWTFKGELTKRELEITNLVAKGMNTVEIAEKLFINERTVENHKYNIMKKIGVPKRRPLYSFLLEQINKMA